MKKLLLLDYPDSGSKSAPQIFSAGPDILAAHWRDHNIPDGHISIPALLEKNLIRIRSEHMRWAYSTGYFSLDFSSLLYEKLEGGDTPSMWWTSLLYERHPRLSPNLYIIYKLRALELLIHAENIGELAYCGKDHKLFLSLTDLCRKSGIRIGYIDADDETPKEKRTLSARLYAATPAPLRALARYAHWWWKIRRRLKHAASLPVLPGNGNPVQDKTATIATYFPNIDMPEAAKGRFLSNYWQSLQELLNEEARGERPDGPHFVRWLFIRFPSPTVDFEECLKLRDIFQQKGRDGLSFNYLEEFLSAGDLFESLKRWFRIWRASVKAEAKARLAFHFQESRICFWPWMKEQWRESFQGWRCLERCLQNLAFKRYCERTGAQRWVLFPLENCPWERMLTLAAREVKNNGRVIGAQHSTIRSTDFRYFDDARAFASQQWAPMQPDIIGGNGRSAIDQWLANGMPESRIRQIEALRYLYLAESRAPENEPQNYDLPPEPGEPLEKPARNRLLVLTSFFREETFAHLKLLGDCLAAGLFEGWSITIKPHPYLSVAEWVDGLPAHQKSGITIVDGPLAMAFKSGGLVWASNSTTAALEALIMRLPLMVMRPVNDFDLCPIQDVPHLARTATVEDVRETLKNPRPLDPEPDYLDLNPELPAWREILELTYCQK